jgi:hypothetical protein
VRHLRMVGVCLVAVFAIAAVASASASAAEPEYKACVKAVKNAKTKKYEGGYNNKTCTEVNGKGEGKYATQAAKLPISFEAKSKASTFYYSKPGGGGIVWKVVCTKDLNSAAISEPTAIEGTITFEKCKASNQITKAKAVTCAGSITVPYGGTLHGETVPATGHPGIALVFFAPAYSCGGVTFESVTTFPFVVGEVAATTKGETGVWTVNKTTGAQSLEQWIEEGTPTGWAPVEAEVTAGASTESLRFGLETTEAIGPKKEVVIN